MSNTILNQVYNYYLTSYAPKGTTQYDTHKKSELKNVYNSIVKMNKEAPIYLLDTSVATKQFAVGIKEQARELKNTISSLGGSDPSALLNKKAAYSSNESVVQAKYIGDAHASTSNEEAPSLEIKVEALASPQVNLGAFLPNGKTSLAPGSYSFDVNINDMNYEFQFAVKEDENNLDIQKRLERLINSAGIGLEASIIGDSNARSALRIASSTTGLPEGKNVYFEINDRNTSKQNGTVEYFGLNYMAMEPRNAQFTLNGEECSTNSNHFTIENMFDITLTGVTSEDSEPATIGLKTDLDSLTDNVHTLVNSYNSFLKAAHEYTNTLSRGGKLLGDMNGLSLIYRNNLDSLGIRTGEDGLLTVDDDLLRQTAVESEPSEAMTAVKDFASSLLRKTNQISINPMQYVNRTMVAYKNPGKNFATPYITSPYSGMLFNGYC